MIIGFVEYDVLEEMLSVEELLKVCRKILEVAEMCFACKTEQGDDICLSINIDGCEGCPFYVSYDDYCKAEDIIKKFEEKGVIKNGTVEGKSNKEGNS